MTNKSIKDAFQRFWAYVVDKIVEHNRSETAHADIRNLIPAPTTVDSSLSSSSTNPVQNKVINSALAGKSDTNHTHSEYASSSHNHAASEITSGTLGVVRGGTGATTFTSGAALIGAGTGAVTTRSITNNTATSTSITANTNLITANTLRYAINRTTSVAAADTNYSTYMARGAAILSATPSSMTNGTIAFVYS